MTRQLTVFRSANLWLLESDMLNRSHQLEIRAMREPQDHGPVRRPNRGSDETAMEDRLGMREERFAVRV